MSIKTFIVRQAREIENGEQRTRGNQCASVFRDNDRIYSYGYHYPLLLQIENYEGRKLWVVNDRGYSNTTAKHIGHAWQVADVSAPIDTNGRTVTREDVINAMRGRIEKLRETIASKKRTNTATYRALESQHDRACEMYYKVTGVNY